MSSEKTKKRSSGKTSHTENQFIILSAPANLHFVFGLISSFLEVVTEFAFYFFIMFLHSPGQDSATRKGAVSGDTRISKVEVMLPKYSIFNVKQFNYEKLDFKVSYQ